MGNFSKINPFIYQILHFIRGHSYTKRLILLPMLAAHPCRVFCTKYPPPRNSYYQLVSWDLDLILTNCMQLCLASHKFIDVFKHVKTSIFLPQTLMKNQNCCKVGCLSSIKWIMLYRKFGHNTILTFASTLRTTERHLPMVWSVPIILLSVNGKVSENNLSQMVSSLQVVCDHFALIYYF